MPKTDDFDHRPGWQRDEEAGYKLNILQKIQKKCGVLTVANALSVSRPVLTGIGVMQVAKGDASGITILSVAAATDAEGNIARATGTDDPVYGAIFDAGADWLSAGSASITGIATGLIDPASVAGIYGPKLLNAINLNKARRDGVDMMATDKTDKAVEVGRWAALAPFVVAPFSKNPELWHTIGHISAAVIAVGGLKSSFNQFIRRKKRTQELQKNPDLHKNKRVEKFYFE